MNNKNLLIKNKYIIVKSVISKEICTLITKYVELKTKNKRNVLKGNDPLANVHREYADPLMETILQELTPTVENKIGNIALYPALSFYLTYFNGGLLKPHKDRDSCEVVASIYYGSDESFEKKSWPILLQLDGNTKEIHLDKGDMVIFQGNETTHWRNKYEGNWYVSSILGYVYKNGENSYQKYDQRKNLGLPHVGMFKWSLGKIKNKVSKFISK